MKSVLSLQKMFAELKKLVWIWLALAVVVGIVIVMRNYQNQTGQGIAKAQVNFSYDGIESGTDPQGNNFEPKEMKSAEIIRAAATEIGLSLDEEGIAKIQKNITISGNVSEDILKQITEYNSIFQSGETASTASVQSKSFFPTQYTVTFRYANAGYNLEQGNALLQAILSAYKQHFYSSYGYNASLEQSLQALDYHEYDYEKATDFFNAELDLLSGYVKGLQETDSTGFCAESTGLSFADLIDTADTIRTSDLKKISAYVSSNNLTKSREEQIGYYKYKIQTLERNKMTTEAKLTVLNELIENYAKTRAVVSGYSGESADGSTSYSFTTPSATYDDLVNQRVTAQVNISSYQRQIDLYTSRMQSLSTESSTGSAAKVEEMLEAVNLKVDALIGATSKTASEYFETTRLANAVDTRVTADGSPRSFKSVVKSSVRDAAIVELFLGGVYLLCATVMALLPQGWLRKNREAQAEPKKKTRGVHEKKH